MNKFLRKAAAPAVLILGVGVGATALDSVHDPIPQLGAQASPMAIGGAEGLSSVFREASRAALPGVVFVEVESAPRAARTAGDPFRGTPFEEFFGPPRAPQQQAPRQGSGSGFIISPDGYLFTNNHVVADANRVTVTLSDRRQFNARVIGRDPNTDVAVLKIDAENLPTVRLGSAEGLEVGDWVLALGYPLSLGETVTAGIVSAKGRNIGIMRQNREAAAPLEHFIQTDAAINPGNSGGPLVNLRGEVVGINTAIASPTGTYAGYGFAVPIQLARRVANDLIQHGVVNRPRIGVEIRDVEPADVEVFGLPDANGSVVASLQDGPARDAGMRLGDVIVAVDGTAIPHTSALMERIALRQPGERVALDIIRYGKRQQVTLRLAAFESEPVARTAEAVPSRDATSRLGFGAVEVTPGVATQLGIREVGGVVITQVDPLSGAPRSLSGLRPQTVNGREVRSLDDLRRVGATVSPGNTVSIVGRLPNGNETIMNYRIRE
ncbi:Do family serine endopeptidase [soil metagenome]